MPIKKKLSTKPIKIEVPILEKQDSFKQDSFKQDSALQETSLPPTTEIDSGKQETILQETDDPKKQENTLPEYRKVAMRLSKESAERLRQFRGDTGIPYEILVDVLVRNWDSLPPKTQKAYLEETQQLRAQRLIAGQAKAMLTTQQKYAQH